MRVLLLALVVSAAVAAGGRALEAPAPAPQAPSDPSKEPLLSLADPDAERQGAQLFAMGEEQEKQGNFLHAISAYESLPESAAEYEMALLQAVRCHRMAAEARWAGSSRGEAARAAASAHLKAAERTSARFCSRMSDPRFAPRHPGQARARDRMVSSIQAELARFLMHEAVGRTAEAITLLGCWSSAMPADDARLALNWSVQIEGHLGLGGVEAACGLIDAMLKRFPDASETPESAKRAAAALYTETLASARAGRDRASIDASLRRVRRYTMAWFDRLVSIQAAEVLPAADRLQAIARRLNGLDRRVESFLDLNGRPIREPDAFMDAAAAYLSAAMASGGERRDAAALGLARCSGFAGEWDEAVEAYEMRTGGRSPDHDVELGFAASACGDPEKAAQVFARTVRWAEPQSRAWWISRYMLVALRYSSGQTWMAEQDLAELEGGAPEWMRGRIVELKRRITSPSEP